MYLEVFRPAHRTEEILGIRRGVVNKQLLSDTLVQNNKKPSIPLTSVSWSLANELSTFPTGVRRKKRMGAFSTRWNRRSCSRIELVMCLIDAAK